MIGYALLVALLAVAEPTCTAATGPGCCDKDGIITEGACIPIATNAKGPDGGTGQSCECGKDPIISWDSSAEIKWETVPTAPQKDGYLIRKRLERTPEAITVLTYDSWGYRDSQGDEAQKCGSEMEFGCVAKYDVLEMTVAERDDLIHRQGCDGCFWLQTEHALWRKIESHPVNKTITEKKEVVDYYRWRMRIP